MKITVRARRPGSAELDTSWSLLDRLERQSDLAHLKRDSVLLLAILEEEFEQKRGEGGLYQELRENCPGRVKQVYRLEAEEQAVLERVRSLLVTCDGLLERLCDVWGDLHSVRSAFAHHGRTKERLLQDVYSCDLGGEGA